MHHQHTLVHLRDFIDLRSASVNFTDIMPILNPVWDEGVRAVKDGDYKEDPDVIEA